MAGSVSLTKIADPEINSRRKSWKTKKPQIPENEKQIDKGTILGVSERGTICASS
jgi:hypothetical protein